ncbi:MAG: hypothetical protein AB7O62_00220 [Pirellulales bacterium]
MPRAEGKRWTEEEDARLRALVAAGESNVAIAEALGRGVVAVACRRWSLFVQSPAMKASKAAKQRESMARAVDRFAPSDDPTADEIAARAAAIREEHLARKRSVR